MLNADVTHLLNDTLMCGLMCWQVQRLIKLGEVVLSVSLYQLHQDVLAGSCLTVYIHV